MIAVDVETTGVDPEKNSLLSIGAVDFENPTNQFYGECHVWDGAEIVDEALAVNGFTREQCMTSEKQSEAELIRSFSEWVQDVRENRMFGGQNVSFDYEMLRAAYARAGVSFSFNFRRIDVHTLTWGHMSGRGITPPSKEGHSAITLNTALEYCGIPKEPDPHNALTGAKSHAEVISRIAYTKKLLPDFSSYDIPWTHSH